MNKELYDMSSSRRIIRSALAPVVIAAAASLLPMTAHAQLGVSDDRVSLPGGPGSLEGVGENVQAGGNMGLMSYQVAIDVPEGYPGMTPQLALSYSSGNGSSSLGIGWDLSIPTIERMTWKGLPEYDTDDLFAVNGGDQLVEVASDGDQRTFRARFEKSFVRYRWIDSGDGDAGYWLAEYPDGRVGYFGADRDGTPVAEARITGSDGQVFRYHLVEMVDLFGHHLRYRYRTLDNVSLIDRIEYVHRSTGEPRFSVAFGYQLREDVVSDAGAGFEMILARRLTHVDVLSDAARIRRYQLEYQPYDQSGGLSRLAGVKQLGHLDEVYPIRFTFGYSRALGGVCSGQDCASPFVVDMGTLPGGADLATGDVTLVDIDGDSLPDVIDTSRPGAHRFARNILDSEGVSRFDSQVVLSAVGSQASHRLSAATVQTLDVNGDGFSDLINTITGEVLCNDGSGDWSLTATGPDGLPCLADSTLGDQLQADTDEPGDPNPLHVRFVDIDNDKRIDILRTPSATSTQVLRNTEDGFVPLDGVEVLGWVFDEDPLRLADINGDGLLDVARFDSTGRLQYRLHLGFGKWGPIVSAEGGAVLTSELPLVQIDDINGDNLADVVVVRADELRFARNRNAGTFDDFVTVTSAQVQGELPRREATTTVVVADMNGNGTQDVVWFSGAGRVQYLELFPVRPNLLSRVENGIGSVQEVEYGTSVAHQARDREDGVSWKYLLPHAMNVVERTDTWVTLTGDENRAGLHEIIEFRYRHGFYDSAEKRFRGFERTETHLLSDESQEAGLTVSEYDVGVSDVYRNGLLLSESLFGGDEGARRAIRQRLMDHGECRVDEVPTSGLGFPVRSICLLSEKTVLQEGAATRSWAVTRTDYEYDGYGNATRVSNLGVVHRGSPDAPAACGICQRDDDVFGEPCGATCTGDEAFVETEYVAPGSDTDDRWILGRAFRQRQFGVSGGETTETTTYYDGAPFVGLPAGQLERGLVSRAESRVASGSDETIALVRNRHDEHGNVVETIDPNGSLALTDSHRRIREYDALGLRLRRTESLLTDDEGTPYRLRQEMSYEPLFTRMSEATATMRVVGGDVRSSRNSTFYRYDAFGRLSRLILPGDSNSAPSAEITYDLSDPASRIIVRRRSQRGGENDLETVRCLDGRGREFQSRTRLSDGQYQVSGFTEYNQRGAAVRTFQPHVDSSSQCATRPPADAVASTQIRYDALFRSIQATLPDDEHHGKASEQTTEFGPLHSALFDPEDNDPTSPHFNTPMIQRTDGLGRITAIERHLEAVGGGQVPTTQVYYDALGRLRGYRDAAGNTKTQRYDLLGRVLEIDDPNAGVKTYQYDAAGNAITIRDGRGVVTRARFDGANRLIARWDDADRANTQVTLHYDVARNCSSRKCTNIEGKLAEALYPVDLGDGVTIGRDEFGFDPRGQRIYQNRKLHGHSFVIERDYDNADRMIRTRYPDGQELQHSYDGASRLAAIDGVLDTISYDDRGQLAFLQYRGGTATSYTYDQRQRLAGLLTFAGDGQVLQGFAYSHDRAGNLLTIEDLAEARKGHTDATAAFGYDAWYRLLDAELGGALPSPDEQTESLRYRHDVIGNIVSATSSRDGVSTAHVGDYTYDAARPNGAIRAGDLEQAFDSAGHVIERGGQHLTWDFMSRLTQVDNGTGDTVARFAYGHDEERVVKRETDTLTYYIAPEFEVRDGIGVLYARMGRQRVARLQSDVMATTLLSDLAPLDASGSDAPDGEINAADAWVAHAANNGLLDAGATGRSEPIDLLRSSARRLLMEADGGPIFLHADHLGSLTLATDKDGQVRGERAYHPFGDSKGESGHVDTHGFTGQERDASTGLLHFRHRYLDTTLGRWLSPDPMFSMTSGQSLSYTGEFNVAYGYVANNPSNLVDPLGLVATPRAYTTKAMNGQFRGEHLPGHAQQNNHFGALMAAVQNRLGHAPQVRNPVRYLNNAQERAPHKLYVRRSLRAGFQKRIYVGGYGIFRGRRFDTTNGHTLHSGAGGAIFVMSGNGTLYASTRHGPGGFKHSSFLAGNPVAAAGEMVVNKGKLTFINNESGHYTPSGTLVTQALTELRARGLDVNHVTTSFR